MCAYRGFALDSGKRQVIEVEAPAKVNLGLRILGRRRDGYHDLDTVFQAISLFDRIELLPGAEPPETAREGVGRYVAPDGLWLEVDSPWPVPCDETNLAVGAARLVARETRASLLPLGIRVEKAIPPGGGLGGGSADAAGVLVGLRELWCPEVSDSRLRAWGLELGSDVPFCLVGGTARGGGRGEILTSVSRKLEFWMTIVNPGVTVKTAKAFAAFDRRRHTRPGDLAGLVKALEEGRPSEFLASLVNSFEYCLDEVYPELRGLKKDMESAGSLGSLLSGSGATVYGVFWNETEAQRAAKALEAKYRFVRTVRPIVTGARVRTIKSETP